MAYTINLTNGNIFAVIPDGTINTGSSMILVGKNYAGYGEFLDENFIHLLENSSNTTAPTAPLTGQLWWDSLNNLLKVYNGSTFKTISAATASSTPPTSNVTGDLWYNTSAQILYVYTGTSFLAVGPSISEGTGTQTATITDNTANNHSVVQFVVNNQIVGMVSKDATFTPATPIAGFAGGIKPGITLSTSIANVPQLFQGTATDSQALDGLDSTQFLRSDINDTTTGTLGVLNDTGFTVGQDNDFKANVSGSTVFLSNQTQDGNIVLNINQGGVTTAAININGSTGRVTVPATFSVGNIVNQNANGVGNIGNSVGYFNTIFAKATSAQYADVAERFAADMEYLPGTVVELGGTAEITCSKLELSDSVFGVISTQAAYLMNSAAGSDATHPPVAMTGRVPVRVVGQIHKGDRLVSAGNGLARSAKPGEATAFNVLGRALHDKLNDDEGTVEAIVTIK